MIALTHMAGRRAAVFGLGGSGMATAHALAAGGAEIVCFDDRRERVEAAWDAGLPTGDLRVADFAAFDALVLAPGVPLTHPEPHWTVARARAADVDIIGDIELFDRERRARLPHTRLVAITGTNGKSTTTALVGHLLSEMGAEVQIGGNIGRPALDLDPFEGIVVLEVSSYQIDLSPTLAPDVGVLLNISPDHIDRHGSFASYQAIKERLPDASGGAVLARDGAWAERYARAHRGRQPMVGCDAGIYPAEAGGADGALALIADPFWSLCETGVLAAREPLRAKEVPGGWDLYRVIEGRRVEPIGALADAASLRGDHNAQNAAAALGVVLALGLDPSQACRHLATFPGLPHRLEVVGRAGDVLFVNDSKATNAQSAWHALAAFDAIHWIAGGVPKAGGIAALAPLFPRIAAAYLIGEAADDFAATLEGHAAVRRCGTLERALEEAAGAAACEGGVVLLSPACASFDQFRSFEERGDVFRALVAQRLEKGAE